MPIQIKKNTEHQIDKTRKENPTIYPNQNTKNTEQREYTESCKSKSRVIYKGKFIRITTDFSVETFKDRGPGAVHSEPSKTKMTNLGYYTQQNYLP